MSAMPGWLVLAPHLDDAALSCGAVLASAAADGEEVVVATVFAGDPDEVPPAARSFHADCGLPDDEATARRRAEDLRACATLGVAARHLPLVDAIYRRVGDGPLADDSADVLSARAADEPRVVEQAAEAIADLVSELRPARTWACAAVSPHVDHEIVRLAALRALGDGTELWEDHPVAGEPRAGWATPDGWVRASERLEPWGWQRQLDAVARYPSQLRMLFGDDDIATRLRRVTVRDAAGAPVVPFWAAPGTRS